MSASDGKIYITISDKTANSGAGIGSLNISNTTTNITNIHNSTTINKSNNLFFEHQFVHFINSQAKNMINYSLANIGNFTGDYQTQREVNNALSAMGVLTNIGMSALAGAKFGPAGAVIGAVIATASQAINIGMQEHSANISYKKQNYEIDMLRKISGLDVLTNGGRI